MNIILNGEKREIRPGWTVKNLVLDLKLEDHPVAVERNQEVVPKSKFQEVPLCNGDKIEIVHFVGGG